jgi:hypothetical protein
MIMVKATKESEAEARPTDFVDESLIAAMATYHEALAKAVDHPDEP